MTYGDIIEWIEENYDFEPDEDARAAFNSISEDWKADNRDTLANTLGQEAEPFIRRIQDLISETDEEDKELVQRVDALERGIDSLFTEFGQIIRGKDSIVLPKGFTLTEPDIITREFIESFEPEESIITRISNFFRGLFR